MMAPQINNLELSEALAAMRGVLIQLELASHESRHAEVRRGLTHLERLRRRAIKAVGEAKPWNRHRTWVQK